MPQAKPHKVYTVEYLTQVKPDSEQIVNFAVTVQTGKVPYGGTDADVYFDIGAKSFYMDTPGYDDFEQGDVDTYYFHTDITLGELRRARLVLHHNNAGSCPGWYVQNFVLQVQFPNSPYMVLYKRWGNVGWLAKDEKPYFSTEAELQPGQPV